MIPVLSLDGAEAIARVAADRGLLVFDFDGTLAPIVSDRARAVMRPVTQGLLRVAALLYPCAVVSGRDRGDVAERVASAPLVEVVGNHGAEIGPSEAGPGIRARVKAWGTALETALAGIPGIELELKSSSIAVHYRSADLGIAEITRIAVIAARLPGSRVFGGDAVVNVVPAHAPTKGSAIEALARRNGARTVMFVGDDVTDEDAFRSEAVTCAIRVGEVEHSAAPWFIRDQREIDALLQALVDARSEPGSPGGA